MGNKTTLEDIVKKDPVYLGEWKGSKESGVRLFCKQKYKKESMIAQVLENGKIVYAWKNEHDPDWIILVSTDGADTFTGSKFIDQVFVFVPDYQSYNFRHFDLTDEIDVVDRVIG